jgi:1,4-dihydroxy-2-naphthoate octaprenyltransferase
MKKRIIAVIIACFATTLISLIVVWIFNENFEKIFPLFLVGTLVGIFITYKDKDENKKDISAQKDVDEK